MIVRLASWNVNGIRACTKNGFFDWMMTQKFDFIGLQEVRADENQIPEILIQDGTYFKNWFPATSKKGYSGVAILSKSSPLEIIRGIGIRDFDQEGRVITGVFEHLIFVSAYFPNSQDKGTRLGFKLEFCSALKGFLDNLGTKYRKCVVLCGDYNIAPFPIDLARPDDNEKTAGYLPEERAWMKQFLDSGWVDSFRYKYPDRKDIYSWWSARLRARDRNIGWRIDFHSLPVAYKEAIVEAGIQTEVMGSDHCPVTLSLNL